MALTPDFRLRKGDVVAVLATVLHDVPRGDKFVHLSVEGNYSGLMLEPHQIEAVVRRSFKVGERVRLRPGLGSRSASGNILAIDGDNIWLKTDGETRPITAIIDDLELLEPWPERERLEMPPPEQPPLSVPASIEI